jgi:hypothetical protein
MSPALDGGVRENDADSYSLTVGNKDWVGYVHP